MKAAIEKLMQLSEQLEQLQQEINSYWDELAEAVQAAE